MLQNIHVSIIIIFLSLCLIRGREEKRKEAKRRESIRKENGKIEEKKMCLDVQRREMKEIECVLHFYPFNL